jgi:hypothetical protein
VRRIVSLINAMPIAQPGTISCPELRIDGARVITTKFRARAGASLARATYTDYPPLADRAAPALRSRSASADASSTR